MINQYRNYKNSVMLVYDNDKSKYGLNPLNCYRLSIAAIKALSLDDQSKNTDETLTLIQDKIREEGLSIDTFFEDVPMKIHRSHLLQAFLFDHIAP